MSARVAIDPGATRSNPPIAARALAVQIVAGREAVGAAAADVGDAVWVAVSDERPSAPFRVAAPPQPTISGARTSPLTKAGNRRPSGDARPEHSMNPRQTHRT